MFEHFSRTRYPAGRSGNNPSKVKRVVSCKRKSHHLMVTRRKPPGISKTCDAANKENEMNCMQDMQQEIFDMDPWEFPLNVTHKHRTGETGFEQDDYCTFAEVRHIIQLSLYLCCGFILTLSFMLMYLSPLMYFSSKGIIAR